MTEAAARILERLGERAGGLDDEARHRLGVVATASPALGRLLVADELALPVLLGDLGPASAADAQADAAGAAAAADRPALGLAGAQRRGLLRVAARDLLGLAGTPQVTVELSDLAQGVLAAALEMVEPPVPLAVIAMGKLGGRELNYVSDVDVIFVGGEDWTAAGRRAEQFLRLARDVTPVGHTYEVDPNLRPEGKDGPLVRTLESYRAYYERWAKQWEFQALLKARPLAGDAALGDAFMRMAEPYVWPDRLDPEAVAEIQRLKGVVESSREVVRAGARQVKLAPGGLRDIEFAVQLLQLVHGRHDTTLRSGNTLQGLAALAEGGYVDDDDARAFGDAYVFLRTVEHRLQLVNLRRTHTLPESDDERLTLAEGLGFDGVDAFDVELRRVQGLVRTIHSKLFYRPLLTRFAQLSAAEQLGDGHGLDRDAARERLEALGFGDPAGALRHLAALAEGLSRRAKVMRTVLPAVLPTLAAAPDPDRGLAALRSLADQLGDAPFVLQTLRDNPPVADLLARVLGSSELVGRWLERQPEVLRLLADSAELARPYDRRDYQRLVEGLRRRGDAEGTADALRRLRRREVARVAIRDLGGLTDVVGVAGELSALAESFLQAAVEHVVELSGNPDLRLAVIGMGKLGGSELGYASDLDILLVAEPSEALADAEEAAEALLKLLSGITPEGQAFLVDANLRPEGKDGALARSLAAYRAYYERWGEPWEMQALTQARFVAGDRALGRAFVSALQDLVYPASVPAERLTAVRRMKARVERERGGGQQARLVRPGTGARPGGPRRQAGRDDARVDLKLGPGGMADVEWTAQLLQLREGGRLPALRRAGALAVVQACVDEGVLPAEDGAWLVEGWTFLAGLRNALYLAGARQANLLPVSPQELERLARMRGYASPGAQALREDVTRTMRRVRRVHERHFYD